MVAITNVGSWLNVKAGSQVESLREIARRQQIFVNKSVHEFENNKLRRKQQPLSAEHTQGAVVPGMAAHSDHALAEKGDLSAAKTAARTLMGQGSNPSQVDSLQPAAVNTRRALVHLALSEQNLVMPQTTHPAGESDMPPGLAKDPFAGLAGENKNIVQGGDMMRAMATPPQAGVEVGNKTPAPDGVAPGNRSQNEGALGEAADARNPSELPSGAAAGAATLADNQATEARAGQPALNRQAHPGHMANMTQENHGANSGRTLTYTFNSVPGNHNVQVTTGQSVTLLPSSHEVIRQLAGHQLPEDYRLLPTRDEQQQHQQHDQEETSEEEV